MHISYSSLRDFKKCPKLYRLKSERRPIPPEREKKTFVGTILGSVIEQFYKERWWREPASVEARMVAYGIERAVGRTERKKIDWLPSEWQAVLDAIHETVPKIIAVIKQERLLGVRNEAEYEGVVLVEDNHGAEHTVHGRIDLLIVYANGDMVLLDAKAGKSLGKFVDTDQLRLYCLMIHRMFGHYPKRVGFWWLRFGKIVWKRVSAKTLAKFKSGVANTLTDIVLDKNTPTPGSHCRYCDFYAECDEGKQYLFDKEASKCPLDIPAGAVTFGSF